MAFGTGLIWVYSSTSGVVMPAFQPMVPDLAQQIGAVEHAQLAWHREWRARRSLSALSTVSAPYLAAATATRARRSTRSSRGALDVRGRRRALLDSLRVAAGSRAYRLCSPRPCNGSSVHGPTALRPRGPPCTPGRGFSSIAAEMLTTRSLAGMPNASGDHHGHRAVRPPRIGCRFATSAGETAAGSQPLRSAPAAQLVAQVWYNMLGSHARKRTVVASPRHSGAGQWPAIVGANGTPYGTQRAVDTLSDVL